MAASARAWLRADSPRVGERDDVRAHERPRRAAPARAHPAREREAREHREVAGVGLDRLAREAALRRRVVEVRVDRRVQLRRPAPPRHRGRYAAPAAPRRRARRLRRRERPQRARAG